MYIWYTQSPSISMLVLLALFTAPSVAGEEPVSPVSTPVASITRDEQQQLANQLAAIFRAARKVLSDNQDLINDPAKGDKGLTAEVVLAKAVENYQAATHTAMPVAEGGTRSAQAIQALLDAVRTVMGKAQPLINEPGKGFKGFLPAVFAAQVAAEFSQTMAGTAFIKLTAPMDLIRNRRNRPDEWEAQVIEGQFKAATWVKGTPVLAHIEHRGRKGERLMLPEYYVESCMQCHGGPKGDRDITGGLKEGARLGDLGGAISVVIYDQP